jgi:hypothetical protein
VTGLKYRKNMMRSIVLIISLALTGAAYSQNWGAGIRLGDPNGITLKKYRSGSAFELNVGRTHGLYGRGWYDRRFDGWYPKQNFNYQDFQYLGYRSSVPLGIQVHYLLRRDIAKISGLEWYFGGGGQLRYQSYEFDYRYRLTGDPRWHYARGGRSTDWDVGVDGVIGMEYFFRDVPFSLFLDLTLFVEVADNPFMFWTQGGIGGRYLF